MPEKNWADEEREARRQKKKRDEEKKRVKAGGAVKAPAERRETGPARDDEKDYRHNLGALPRQQEARYQDVEQTDRQKEFPAEGHQLVITKARQRAAHPDVEKEIGRASCRERV